MSNLLRDSTKNLLIAAIIGASVSFFTTQIFTDTKSQSHTIARLENRIKTLELALASKDKQLLNMRFSTQRQAVVGPAIVPASTAQAVSSDATADDQQGSVMIAEAAQGSLQTLKDLETSSPADARSFSEKITDLLAGEPSKEKIAIASKSIFDMAMDRDNLPDYALESIYHDQQDVELKRVVAQVLSMRGDNRLIENQISETQSRLKSDNARDRQNALLYLAKTHNVNAAAVIAPMLDDPDINVKLEALQALRATGNQTHVSLVEKLLNDPDPAVSSLAKDVISNLQNLSDSARTTLASADVAAELPMMENP